MAEQGAMEAMEATGAGQVDMAADRVGMVGGQATRAIRVAPTAGRAAEGQSWGSRKTRMKRRATDGNGRV